jgi:manganese transport protein
MAVLLHVAPWWRLLLDARAVVSAGELRDRSPAESSADAGARASTRRIGLLLGPAFVAAVAYVDPGNFATNIQGGSALGYSLVWVVVAANLLAMLIQTLSAKLGLVTGQSLPELIRDRAPQRWVVISWLCAEVVAMATDLAEVLGAALGLQLLTGIALLPATLICGAATFIVLILQQRGMPLFEGLIAVLVGVIAVCYVIETAMGKPSFAAAGHSFLPPELRGANAVIFGTGILGATVMPHIVYLHSALMRDRGDDDPVRTRHLLRLQVVDVMTALGLAGVINVLMLMLAAATFHAHGFGTTATIPEAYRTLTPILGSAASAIFGISLLASGLSASAVGTLAGSLIMRGFLRRSIPVWVRRLVTMAPAVIVAGVGLDATHAMVVSQVVLSFGLPPALIPLVWLTGRLEVMGEMRNRRGLQIIAWTVVGLISLLDLYLLEQALIG